MQRTSLPREEVRPMDALELKALRTVFGTGLFDHEDWARSLRVSPPILKRRVPSFPWKRLTKAYGCPFTGRALDAVRFAFLGLKGTQAAPVTILNLAKRFPRDRAPHVYFADDGEWKDNAPFARDATPEFRWYMMTFGAIPNSTGKNYIAQEGMLPAGYEVPSAAEFILGCLLFYRKNGRYPFGDSLVRVRCRDLAGGGDRVVVGLESRNSKGLAVTCEFDERESPTLGIAASHVLPSAK